jgi:hypothetical protein
VGAARWSPRRGVRAEPAARPRRLAAPPRRAGAPQTSGPTRWRRPNTVPWRMSTCTADGDVCALMVAAAAPRPAPPCAAARGSSGSSGAACAPDRPAAGGGRAAAPVAERSPAARGLAPPNDVAEVTKYGCALAAVIPASAARSFHAIARPWWASACNRRPPTSTLWMPRRLFPVEFAIDEPVCYSRTSLTDRGHARCAPAADPTRPPQRFGDPHDQGLRVASRPRDKKVTFSKLSVNAYAFTPPRATTPAL